MSRLSLIINNKYLLDQIFGLTKFIIIVGLFCFLVIKAPNEVSNTIGIAGAFILGGSKIKSKLGL